MEHDILSRGRRHPLWSQILIALSAISVSSAQNDGSRSGIWYYVPGAARQRQITTLGVATSVTTTNVPVNQDSGDQNETTIAVNPLNANIVVSGSNYSPPTTDYRPGYYYSTNAGAAPWGHGILPLGGSYGVGGDPSVSFDRLGNVYYGHISFDRPPEHVFALDNGVFINKSTDHGVTWLPIPFVVSQNGTGGGTQERTIFDDKPYLTCDAVIGSPYQNNVYISWTKFVKNAATQIYFRRLSPNGSFGPAIQVSSNSDLNLHVSGSVPAVGPNGVLYLVWYKNDGSLHFNMSTDGGSTFTGDVTIVMGLHRVTKVNEKIRANSFPSIAIDNSGDFTTGNIYVVWADSNVTNQNPDILLVTGSPSQSSIWWNPPSRLNQSMTNDQWSPWVSVAPNGVIQIVWYDRRNDVTNKLTDVYVATSVDGAITFVETKVNSQSFDPVVNLSEFIGDYNGIASTIFRALPFWTDTRGGIDNDVYTALFDQPVKVVSVNQKKEDGMTNVGTIGRWDGNSFNNPRYNPGPIPLLLDSREILQGDTNVYTFQKYHDWTDPVDVTNHHPFPITSSTTTLTSNFRSVANATIQTGLIDGAGGNGTIKFADPWYLEPTSQYFEWPFGYKSLGTGAVMTSRSSPIYAFYPNVNLNYKGVFLSQPIIVGRPYYSVGAVDTQMISGFTSYFLGWEATIGSASFQNSGAAQTAVVFNVANTTVTARYKAHLGSSSSDVTSPSAQRKVIRDASGNFHMAYASAGHIWYSRSTDSGATWSQETRLSSESYGTFINGTPSLTVQENTHLVVVVWERYVLNGSTYHDIMACLINPATGVPGAETVIGQWTGSPSQGLLSGPVIASGKASTQYLLALWFDPQALQIKGAIRSDALGSWGAAVALRSVSASYLSIAPISVSGYHDTTWHVTWVENGNLTYGEITIGTNLTLSNITTIATGDWEIQSIKNPSIASYQNGQGANRAVAVAWQEYVPAWYEDVIKEREYVINNSWGTITVWAAPQKTPVPYVTPSLSANYQSITKAVTWRLGANQVKLVKYQNDVWSSATTLCNGIDPTLSVGWTNPSPTRTELALTRNSSGNIPYALQRNTVTINALSKVEETPTQIAQGRAAKFVFERGMIYLVLATPAFNGTPIAFVAADDSTYDLRRIKQALRTEGFSGTGLASFDVTCHRSGKVPSGARVAFQVRDAGTDQLLAEFASFEAVADTMLSVSLPLRYCGRQVRLALDFAADEQCRAYELECWNIILDEGASSPGAEAEHKGSMATDLLPKDYALHANYPNPFNPSTRFDFDLPKGANIAFMVFDVLGRRVVTIKEGYHDAGYHSVVWDAHNIASGVYYARFTASDEFGRVKFSKVNKLLLMK